MNATSAPVAPRAAPAEAASDEELVGACARGDEDAFVDLLRRHRDRIVQLVRWRLGAQDPWVEDVAQDVFLRVHRHARRFEARSSFKTWLYAIAVNVCRDHVRQRRRRPQEVPRTHDPEVLAVVPDRSLGPFDLLDRAEQVARLRAALDRLSPAYRTVLQLRDWEDLSYEEIAQVLDVPIGTVRSRLHNARVALARELTEGPA